MIGFATLDDTKIAQLLLYIYSLINIFNRFSNERDGRAHHKYTSVLYIILLLTKSQELRSGASVPSENEKAHVTRAFSTDTERQLLLSDA